MKDTLIQLGGIQTVFGFPKVVYLVFESNDDSAEVMSDSEISQAVFALNKAAAGTGIVFTTRKAPADEKATVLTLEKPAKGDYKSLVEQIGEKVEEVKDIDVSDKLTNITSSFNNFASKFNLPTVEINKEKTDLMEGDISFTVSSPVNPYFGTEGSMTYSCGGLKIEKTFTSGGVVTSVTYDKSAAYADAEYTSHGKPVGNYKRASGTLDISGPWGSYSGTNLVSNGSNTYDGTFGAAPQLKNAMGGIQKQFGVDQIVYLDFDGALTEYDGTEQKIENVEVQNSGITEARAALIAAELNQKYAGTGVVFVTEKPVMSDYSTVFVGETSAFDRYGEFDGIAETNDTGNQNKSDNAFVMKNAMSSNKDIVDTISHEVDHLLGKQDHGGAGLSAYAQSESVDDILTGAVMEAVDGNVDLSDFCKDSCYEVIGAIDGFCSSIENSFIAEGLKLARVNSVICDAMIDRMEAWFVDNAKRTGMLALM